MHVFIVTPHDPKDEKLAEVADKLLDQLAEAHLRNLLVHGRAVFGIDPTKMFEEPEPDAICSTYCETEGPSPYPIGMEVPQKSCPFSGYPGEIAATSDIPDYCTDKTLWKKRFEYGCFRCNLCEPPTVGPAPDVKVTECTCEDMDFGNALLHLKLGLKLARKGWNGKNMWIELQGGLRYENSMTPDRLPHLVIVYPVGHPAYPDGCLVPWLASQTDLLADDWYVV